MRRAGLLSLDAAAFLDKYKITLYIERPLLVIIFLWDSTSISSSQGKYWPSTKKAIAAARKPNATWGDKER